MRRFLISFLLAVSVVGLTAVSTFADNWPSGCC